VQAALPDVVQLIHTLAQAEQSAAEWAARYTAEAARVYALAEQNAALVDQIANLTSLLTACAGAQSRQPAEAATAAAFVVGPPSTAAPPEAGAVPAPRWYRWQHNRAGMWHAACRVQPHRAACVRLGRQRIRQRTANPNFRCMARALQGTRTALARKAQRITPRPLLCFRLSIHRTAVMPSPLPPPFVCPT
jgi:hypothetical protein